MTIYSISDLSKHLFWEYDTSKLNWFDHKELIILRVLEYGNDSDWNILKNTYSKKEIRDAAVNTRSMDIVTLHFVSVYTGTPITDFRCYKNGQSIRDYSGY